MSLGTLYIVGTPIGNLEDISARALETLKKVEVIACEDTRRTRQLLTHFGITGKRLLSHHQGNERRGASGLVKMLKEGISMAYVSDGGMPTVSDPGYLLVKAAVEAEIEIVPIGGVTAVTTALAASGMPAARFVFLGFVPRKKGEQTKLWERFVEVPEALVIYESPKRIKKTVAMALEVLGDRNACMCRELTKLHEEFLRMSLGELLVHLEVQKSIKGEITLIISGSG